MISQLLFGLTCCFWSRWCSLLPGRAPSLRSCRSSPAWSGAWTKQRSSEDCVMHSNRSQQPPNMHYSDPFAAPRQWDGRLNVNVGDCSLRARRWKSSGWFHREVIISLALFFREPCSDIQLEGVPTADDTVLMSLALALKGQLTQLKETLCIGAFSSTQPFWSFTDKRNSTQLCFKDFKTSNCTVLVKKNGENNSCGWNIPLRMTAHSSATSAMYAVFNVSSSVSSFFPVGSDDSAQWANTME